MNTTKPKSRKVAWVVLGVVVLGAALSIALLWDMIWLKVAYVPLGSVIQFSEPRSPKRLEWSAPPNAHSVQSYAKRYEWFPGSARLYVFCDQAGREIVRQPVYILLPEQP